MYQDINHILEKLTRYPKWGYATEETIHYIKNNKVGFKVADHATVFTSCKRYATNYDWELSYDEVIGIVFVEKMIIDDDEQLLIFYRRDKKPIRFTMPTVYSEEIVGLKHFLIKLNEHFDIGKVAWQQDKAIVAYPKHLRGKKFYETWKSWLVSWSI